MAEDTGSETPGSVGYKSWLFSSSDEGESTNMSPEHVSRLKSVFLEINYSSNPIATLEDISLMLAEAAVIPGEGKEMELTVFCNFLTSFVDKILNCREVVQAWSDEEDVEAYLFEFFCRLVELTVVLLTKHNSSCRKIQTLNTRYLLDILEALCIVLNDNDYLILRKEKGIARIVLLHPARLESALQVPGCFVRVRGADITEQPFYYCSKEGVNQMGRECSEGCCDSQATYDAVLVQLSCLMGTTQHGNGYKHIMDMLAHPEDYPLRMLEALFEILATLTFVPMREKQFCTEDFAGRKIVLGIEESAFDALCQRMLHHMKGSIDCLEGDPIDVEYILDSLTSMVHALHRISFLGNRTITSDYAGRLQIALWDAYLKNNIHWNACISIGKALECTSPEACDTLLSPTVFSRWLKDEGIIFNIISFDYDLIYVPEVEDFVRKISRKGMLQNTHLMPMLQDDNSALKPGEERHTSPHDLVVASVMDFLQPSEISTEVLLGSIEWLEHTKGPSDNLGEQVPVSRIMSILEKFSGLDGNGILKERIFDIFWKHTSQAPAADVADCMTRIAACYEPVLVFDSLDLDCIVEGEKDLLQSCSDADADTKFRSYLTSANSLSSGYAKRAEVWSDKELDFIMYSLPKLEQLLTFDVPLSRRDITSECFNRLNLAQHLLASLPPPSQSKLASSMVMAMSPEIQTLKVLETESKKILQVDKKIQALNARHFREFEALKAEHHEKLLKFFQNCKNEKQNMLREVLRAKARVVACKNRAQLDTSIKMSSDALLARMLQKAEDVVREMGERNGMLDEEIQRLKMENEEATGAFKEVEKKYKQTLKDKERTSSCAICYTKFNISTAHSLTRACLNPCGHASVCLSCAHRLQRSTRRCPICQTDIDEVSRIPSVIFL